MSDRNHQVGADYEPVTNIYGDYIQGNITEQKIAYPGLLNAIGECGGKRVLDFGCGVGQVSKSLASMGADVCSVDLAQGMVDAARAILGPAADVRKIERASLPVEWSNSFDVAIACFVLCVMDAGEIVANATEIARTIKPGGRFIVLNTNWEKCNGFEFASFRLNLTAELTSGCIVSIETKCANPVTINDYFWTQNDYCKLLQTAGFVHCERVELPASPDPLWIDEPKAPPFFLIVATK